MWNDKIMSNKQWDAIAEAPTRFNQYIQWLDENEYKIEQALLDVQNDKIELSQLTVAQYNAYCKWLISEIYMELCIEYHNKQGL